MINMKIFLKLIVLACAFLVSSYSAAGDYLAVNKRAREVAAWISENPEIHLDSLSGALAKKDAVDELKKVFAQIYTQIGACDAIAVVLSSQRSDISNFLIECSRGIVEIRISVAEEDSNRLKGVFILNVYKSWDKLSSKIIFYMDDYPKDDMPILVRSGRCGISDPDGVRKILKRASIEGFSPSHGLYWVKNPDREVGYALYIHYPSFRLSEYGANLFSAKIAADCV